MKLRLLHEQGTMKALYEVMMQVPTDLGWSTWVCPAYVEDSKNPNTITVYMSERDIIDCTSPVSVRVKKLGCIDEDTIEIESITYYPRTSRNDEELKPYTIKIRIKSNPRPINI